MQSIIAQYNSAQLYHCKVESYSIFDVFFLALHNYRSTWCCKVSEVKLLSITNGVIYNVAYGESALLSRRRARGVGAGEGLVWGGAAGGGAVR